MERNEIKNLEKSQLMFYFLIARDNLVRVKRMIEKYSDDEDLKYIYQEEEKDYTALLNEIYRRMKKWALMINYFMSVAFL